MGRKGTEQRFTQFNQSKTNNHKETPEQLIQHAQTQLRQCRFQVGNITPQLIQLFRRSIKSITLFLFPRQKQTRATNFKIRHGEPCLEQHNDVFSHNCRSREIKTSKRLLKRCSRRMSMCFCRFHTVAVTKKKRFQRPERVHLLVRVARTLRNATTVRSEREMDVAGLSDAFL